MQWDVAQKSLDYLITHSKDVDKITVAFYGGEPLLNFKATPHEDEAVEKFTKK